MIMHTYIHMHTDLIHTHVFKKKIVEREKIFYRVDSFCNQE